MTKESTMTIRVEPGLRASFNDAAKRNHRPAALVLRDFMRKYVEQQEHARLPGISGDERTRRAAAVNYGRASVGLEGFSLTDADEKHAQRFIDGEIELTDFVKVRNESAHER